MEKSEPSLVPGWLKGSSGSTLAMPHSPFYQDETGSPSYPRSRSQIWGDYDSPRGLAPVDRAFPKRGQNGNLLEKERENHRPHPNLGRSNSSSARSYDLSERERVREQDLNRYVSSDVCDRDREQDADRDFRPKERDNYSGFGSDEWEKRKDTLENGKLRSSVLVNPGKLDSDAKLRRSHSMGLSPRIPENNVRKLNEAVNISSPLPSISTSLATSIQKAVFERNFPSLGTEDKSGSSLVTSINTSIASPRPLWQGSLRSDLGRASSPGLTGGFSGSTSSIHLSGNGGSAGGDVWSSALAEVPISNGCLQNNNTNVNAFPTINSSLTLSSSSASVSASTGNVMNMAEALTQNPPRVRTPPQISVETQRLEELALKQSRQLIPMTPSLPKTMSLAEKAKSKAVHTADGTLSSPKLNPLSGLSQSSSLHRNPARPDTPKHSQGKLVVLKGNKDTANLSNLDLNSSNHALPQIGMSVTASTMSTTGLSVSSTQRKKPQDRFGPSLSGLTGTDAFTGLRLKDQPDEKKSSVQAQNRSDFFNALRKKAASNGSSFTTTLRTDSSFNSKSGTISSSEAVLSEPSILPQHTSEKKEVIQCGLPLLECTPHSNRHLAHSTESELTTSSLRREFPSIEEQEESKDVDSEEEEAAFMRSLGWEENAEGTELTEEEINSFYQMRERRKLFNNVGQYKLQMEHPAGSLGSSSSSVSSSDSDSD